MDRLNALRNPRESPQVRAIATAVAELERDLHGAVQDHYRALEAEPPEDLAPLEERVDQLCRLVEKQVGGDLWGYYVAEQAPDGLENADAARKHAGKDLEEWEETVAGWADGLREQLGGAHQDRPDRDLADEFCLRRFGVPLDVFEAAVVEWTPGETMRLAMRGRVDADIARLQAATAALEGADVQADVKDVQEDGAEEVRGGA